jgi:hypothetical protein
MFLIVNLKNMKEAADQAFQIFAIAVILGFGVVGYLGSRGILAKWNDRYFKHL